MFRFIPLFILSMFICPIVMAQNTITHEGISTFYKASIKAQMSGYLEAEYFFKKHIHDDAKFTIKTQVIVPGGKPKEDVAVYDKQQTIENTKLGYEAGYPVEIKHRVLSHVIAENGESAQVKDSYLVTFLLDTEIDGRKIKVKSEQNMQCDNELILSDGGFIQSRLSECFTRIKMTKVDK